VNALPFISVYWFLWIWTSGDVAVDQRISSLPNYKTGSNWQITFESLGWNRTLLATVEYRKFRVKTWCLAAIWFLIILNFDDWLFNKTTLWRAQFVPPRFFFKRFSIHTEKLLVYSHYLFKILCWEGTENADPSSELY
jgi:hypothetical protein